MFFEAPTSDGTPEPATARLRTTAGNEPVAIFNVQGGAARRPAYQIASPIFDWVTRHLPPGYALGRTFTITARKNFPAIL